MADAVAVAVLAAGRGTRFGGGKLDAPCAGKPVGRWVLDAVAGAGLPGGLLVVPPQGVAFVGGAPGGWQTVTNPEPERGLGSSLALAAQWALDLGAPSLLVLLADMPLVDPAYLTRLIAAAPPAATEHPGGRPGVPALIPARLLPQLTGLRGDEGAARLLAGLPELTMIQPPQSMLLDVDRPEDLVSASTLLAERSG